MLSGSQSLNKPRTVPKCLTSLGNERAVCSHPVRPPKKRGPARGQTHGAPTVENADQQRVEYHTLILIVTPGSSSDHYAVYVGENRRLLLASSRQPLLDGARALLAEGCQPDTLLIMRRADGVDALRARAGDAARLTVDETRTSFARWKPFFRSAVSPRNAPSRSARITLARTPQTHKEDSAALAR